MAAANSHYEELRRSADMRRLAAAGQTSPSRISRMVTKLGFITRRPRSALATATATTTATTGVTDIAPRH